MRARGFVAGRGLRAAAPHPCWPSNTSSQAAQARRGAVCIARCAARSAVPSFATGPSCLAVEYSSRRGMSATQCGAARSERVSCLTPKFQLYSSHSRLASLLLVKASSYTPSRAHHIRRQLTASLPSVAAAPPHAALRMPLPSRSQLQGTATTRGQANRTLSLHSRCHRALVLAATCIHMHAAASSSAGNSVHANGVPRHTGMSASDQG